MKMLKYFVIELLICSALVVAVLFVNALQEDQSGFISIDCGSAENSSYTDPYTEINYVSDAGFIDTGENVGVPGSEIVNQGPWLTARIFSHGRRNCYTLRPEKGGNNKYLIRAGFFYGNYDLENQPPTFDLYIGEDFWTNVKIKSAKYVIIREIIHTPLTDYIHVCLHRTGPRVPFISVLELRPLNNTIYTTESGSLELQGYRYNYGSTSGQICRYKDDVYDRIWDPSFNSPSLRTNFPVVANDFQIPSAIMSTAASRNFTGGITNGSLSLIYSPDNASDQVYLYLHFAEVQILKSNEFRQIEIYSNGKLWYRAFSPEYLKAFTAFSTAPVPAQTKYMFTLRPTENSTLPAIISAAEVYVGRQYKRLGTDDGDVEAIFGIKSFYQLKKNWGGDPCLPQEFKWDGLNCNYDDSNPRIISLNLTSSGLKGSIAPHIANLTFLRTLDLSNNQLDGNVPDFLGQLDALTVLSLKGNNFTGEKPAKLLEKSKQGSLSFSFDALPKNTSKKSNKAMVGIVVSTVVVGLVILFVFIIIWMVRRRKKEVIRKADKNLTKNNARLEREDPAITYPEILKITNNLERVLGNGGFGTVYYGLMGDTEVAVKMINPSSAQGYKEFQVEAKLLMTVHHKNLTSLVGYCNDGHNIGIIYEYMANGNLQQHLSELSWEQRIRIAIDASQGLDYMHHGCRPPIIHRDIKPTNILLNHNFQAKLSDFGLSKVFSSGCSSHVTVNTVTGTLGYLDPECHYSNRLTEKSDIYSFGVVLLEVITGRPVIDKNDENRHITNWVLPLLQKGDIRTIVDERLQGNFNIDCAMKIVELAVGCVSSPSSRRPTMYNVLVELKECLAIEMSNVKTEVVSLTGLSVVESDYDCLAR